MEDEVTDDDTASTADMTALDSDKDGSDPLDNETGAEENRPCRGPAKIMYGGNGTSARLMANKEEKRMKEAAA